MAFKDFIQDVLRAQVKQIRVNTSIYSFPIDDPFGPNPGTASAAMDTLRPEIVLVSADGEEMKIAPWGPPQERETLVKGGAAIAGVGILGLLAWGWLHK